MELDECRACVELKKQLADVTQELGKAKLEEKSITQSLGHTVTREDLERYSRAEKKVLRIEGKRLMALRKLESHRRYSHRG